MMKCVNFPRGLVVFVRKKNYVSSYAKNIMRLKCDFRLFLKKALSCSMFRALPGKRRCHVISLLLLEPSLITILT